MGTRMRQLLAGLCLLLAAGCSSTRDLDGPVDPIGDFRHGFTVVVPSPDYTQGPFSRDAEPAEWEQPIKDAFATRFARFDGDRFYHFGIIIEGFVLAQPGVPVVASPKSLLLFRLTVVEDATGEKLLEEAEQITVLEDVSGASIVGSGFFFTKERQMEKLAEAAAKAVENFLREREDTWFAAKPPLPGTEDDAVDDTPPAATGEAANEDAAEATDA